MPEQEKPPNEGKPNPPKPPKEGPKIIPLKPKIIEKEEKPQENKD
jgi:hypothetical protein